MENFLGHFWSFFGCPRPRDGHSQIPYEKCLPNQGSKPKSVPWEAISWSFSIFGESLCGCFVYVVLLLLKWPRGHVLFWGLYWLYKVETPLASYRVHFPEIRQRSEKSWKKVVPAIFGRFSERSEKGRKRVAPVGKESDQPCVRLGDGSGVFL